LARAVFEHVQLQGSAAFIALTRAALELLRLAECSAEVWDLLAVVRKGKRSGVAASDEVPVIDVGKKVWNSPKIWYASGIGHEGFHIRLYRDALTRSGGCEPALDTWAGVEAERKCLDFQLRVLEQLSAERHYLEPVMHFGP
jgi:hypothetical protein